MATPHQTSDTSSCSTGRRRRVVLVGHCGFDQASIMRAVRTCLPDVDLISVNQAEELSTYTGPDNLLLINRVLDGRFDTDSGIELIRQLAQLPDPPAMMLVSNFHDAQAQAREAGALPGFGKSELADPSTAEKLRAWAETED